MPDGRKLFPSQHRAMKMAKLPLIEKRQLLSNISSRRAMSLIQCSIGISIASGTSCSFWNATGHTGKAALNGIRAHSGTEGKSGFSISVSILFCVRVGFCSMILGSILNSHRIHSHFHSFKRHNTASKETKGKRGDMHALITQQYSVLTCIVLTTS